MTTDWDVVGYVISSDHRTAAVGRLAEGPATPTQIAEGVDISVTHVSRALRELRKRDLVDLLVPEERRKGRIYGITTRGREVWELIESKGLAE